MAQWLSFPNILIRLAAVSIFVPQLAVADEFQGWVKTGGKGIRSSNVTLYATGEGADPRILGSDTTGKNGFFQIDFERPPSENAVLYLIAEGGNAADDPGPRSNGAIRLATMPGRQHKPRKFVINERSTVATAYALAQFVEGAGFDGPYPGLRNAADTVRNLVNVRTGIVGRVLRAPPNGHFTSTMATFNSLANLLAGCVQNPGDCNELFALATPPAGTAPTDTLAAAINIAHNPGSQVPALFALSLGNDTYKNALEPGQQPDAWILAIRYIGNRRELNGPGNIAFDAEGNAWVVNNYVFHRNRFDPAGRVCGDDHLLRFTPTGEDFPGAPYQGGGVYGAGFGVTLDPHGDAWVGNFGFQGSDCANGKALQSELSRSVSQFSSNGETISPDREGLDPGGWQGSLLAIRQPQGTVSDQHGNIWVASCGGDNVVVFKDGKPERDASYTAPGLSKPFGIAIDGESALEPVTGVGVHSEPLRRIAHELGIEPSTLEKDVGGSRLDLCVLAAHDTGQANSPLGVGDDQVLRRERSRRAVESLQGLAGQRSAHDDFVVGQ